MRSSVKLLLVSALLIAAQYGWVSSQTHAQVATEIDIKDFNIPEPEKSSLGKLHWLWATYYYTPTYTSKSAGYPLLDLEGYELGPKLTHKEWCMSALEGSTAIHFNGKLTVYNYAGFGEELQVDCRKYYKYTKSGKLRFRLANGPYGDGANETSYILFPYRTIAVDKTLIPYGTLIYIPAARGIQVSLKSGKKFTHDGYFFAADKGGAIKGTHIDVFEGVEKVPAFSKFVKSTPKGTFKAYIVKNDQLREMVEQGHFKESGILVPGEF
jgi:3D (Asp-Asp-Asp) domain-containing protein